MDDAVTSGRKILREHGDVLMWQEYVDGPHRGAAPLLRYFVGQLQESPKVFTTPHDAFDHFQKLSGAPSSRPLPSPKPRHRTVQSSRRPG
jgi:hypothetical protein